MVDLIEGLGPEFEHRVVIRVQPRIQAYTGIAIADYPYLVSSRPLRRLLTRFRPDIVHVHFVADKQKAWSEADYRWYLHIFDAAGDSGARLVENVNIPTTPFRTPAVDRYVFVSDYVRRRFSRDDDAATVIYPGSDLERFRRPGHRAPPTQTLGLVYRLEADKLNEESIQPIINVLRARAAARAIVVGGGTHLHTYRNIAHTARIQDRVTFTGYVSYSDLPNWYQEMSVFVAPVHNESFGQVSVFAMAMELPVAGYRVGALEEILGEASLLAEPGDADALTRILIDLLDDPERARTIGLRNRARAEEHFGLSAMIARYRTLYSELLADGQPSAR